MIKEYSSDVLIIGAGPAGSLAATLLAKEGLSTRIFEYEQFPRFSIGESLLPQSMAFMEDAGLIPFLEAEKFQTKNGAAFQYGKKHSIINFEEKFTAGPHLTYEVQRAKFDLTLANYAQSQGTDIHYKHKVTSFHERKGHVQLSGVNDNEEPFVAHGKFVLDGSGYGRVLSRLLELENPSSLPPRKAVFCHIKDKITHPQFDRNKILITIHHENPTIWYWLIPFSDGTSSIGAVGSVEEITACGPDDETRLRKLIADDFHYSQIIPDYEFIRPVGSIQGYSASVKSLYGPGFALLGNAAEFLDPIFSSGVTIALKSASLASKILPLHIQGEKVDWESSYAKPLMVGVETFRTFVESWYEGPFQKIIMENPDTKSQLGQMIVSVLAGYAWDEKNLFVKNGKRLLPLIASEAL